MPFTACCLLCHTQVKRWEVHVVGIVHRQRLSMARRRGRRLTQHLADSAPSYSTYVMGCSCSGCCRANAAYHQDYRLARKIRSAEPVPERMRA